VRAPMENQEINQKIIEIWKNSKEEFPEATKLWPLLLPELEKNRILFIGINPGFPKITKRGNYWGELKPPIPNPEEYFDFNHKLTDDEINKEIRREKDAKNPDCNNNAYYKDYFKQMVNMIKEIKKEFPDEKMEHLDLFFVRKTTGFKKLMKYNESEDYVIIKDKFSKLQLNLSIGIMLQSEPKMVIVTNALASKIIQKELNIEDQDFNEETGFHTKNFGNRKVPFLFSGMLSGQRALDRGSRKRLVWHIKQALKFYGANNK